MVRAGMQAVISTKTALNALTIYYGGRVTWDEWPSCGRLGAARSSIRWSG